MHRFLSLIVIATLVLPSSAASAQQPLDRSAETEAFHRLATGIPIGSRVKVRTVDGRALTATLMTVEAQHIVLKRLSRVPEPAIQIAFTDLTELRRDQGKGFSVAKVIGIGLAAGAGAILTLIGIALALED